MKFAKIVFLAAGAWGIAALTPLYFLFDAVARQGGSPNSYPQFYYGFLGVAMAWQVAFFAIGSDPVRFRLMMIPSMAEKFGYVLTMGLLYVQSRIAAADVIVTAPDFILGVLFAIAFSKTPRE